MKASKTSRRLLAVFLAFVMSLTCVPEALAAEKSVSAVTMQLAKTEGTVEVSNSSGKKITLIKNMRLRSGYKVATEEASYAWTNLDSTKLVKLDAVSEMSIRKSGKKLELLLDSGNIFFNVTEQLSEDESLNIRTSTMVVGIRGTSGWVRITDPWTAEISILDGTVAVSVTDPVTGETKTDTVTAGETAVCKVYGQEHSGDKCEITRDKYTADDIDGFVLAELDAPLREKIEDASGLDLSGVDAADRLKADQEEVHQKLEQIEAEAVRQDSNVSTEKVWANPQPDTPSTKPSTSTGTSGGNGGSVPSPAPDESTVTLTMPQTDDTVNDYLSRSAVRTVILKPGTQSQTLASTANMLEVDSGLTVPAGKTLTLQSGVGMTVMGGQTAQVAGTMTVGGDLEVGGNVAVSGRLTVDGAFDGRITPQSGAVIRARKFALSPDVSGWEVSETTDSAGYYTLNPARKTYTITFNANGGTVASASAQTGTDGRLSSLPVPVREGYTFNGWFTSATGGERVTSAYVFTANTTVYAHWTAVQQWNPAEHTYEIIRETLTWSEAQAACEKLGGHLATITSAEEQSYIESLNTGNARLWIGARRDNSNNWTWVTGEPWEYTNWAPGQPDNSPNVVSNENCVVLWPKQWNDLNENNKSEQRGYICEWDNTGTTCTVTFDANGGTVSPTSMTTGADGKLASLPVPVREGYTFDGWFTSATGGEQVTTATVFKVNSTVYARWTQNSASGVTWRMDGTTLYIEGSGPMENYLGQEVNGEYTTTAPWAECRSTATKVVIADGITLIGNYALYTFANVTSVTIPSSVTSIGKYAFWQCSSLTSAAIPASVTSIGMCAFYECSALPSAVIPNGVTSIAESVFHSCTALKSVTIPNSVTSIGRSAFNYCTSLTDVTIPAGVTSIGDQAFKSCAFANITIPKGIASIGTGVFQFCSRLTEVTIPDGVASIGGQAFYSCSSLASVTLPGSVTSIGENAFNGCTALTDAYYPGTRAQWDASVTVDVRNEPLLNVLRFGGSATSGVTWRIDGTTLYIEGNGEMESLANSGIWPWESDKDSITTVSIGNGITTIGDRAFLNFSNLTAVTIPDTVTSIGLTAFCHCAKLTSIELPSGLTSIGAQTFEGCSALTNLTIPDGVTTLPTRFTINCSMLRSIKMGAVTSISANMFENCGNLTSIYYGGTQEQWNTVAESLNFVGGAYPKPTVYFPDGSTISYKTTRSVVSDAAPGYADVPADAWYADAVAYCREHGLMNGTSATEFSPDEPLTRAMTVTVLHRLAGRPAAGPTEAFSDVETGQWYTEAVSWADSQKIVQGYGDGLFGTDDPVTHEQVQLIFRRYSGDSSVETIGADTPNAPATRAEIAATLMAFAKKSELAPGTLSVFSAMNIMCSPSGLAADRDGSLLVTDVYHKQVWRVVNRASESYAGGATVQDLYGQPVGGYNDAGLDGSYFKQPWAIAPFLDGWAVSDAENNVVRLIQGGSVQTINGTTSEKLTVTELGVAFNHPTGLAADDEGNLYVSDTFSGSIRKITSKGGVSTVAKNLSEPMGLCWKDGVLYVAETGKDRVVRIQDGKVSTVASGFDAPQGVAVGDDGSVYVSDTGNGAVRAVRGGKVTTVAARDMASTDAGLTSPVGLLIQDGQLYICDTFARKVFVYQIG